MIDFNLVLHFFCENTKKTLMEDEVEYKQVQVKMRCSTCGHEFTLSLFDTDNLRRTVVVGLVCESARCLPCFRSNRKWSVVVISIA